MILVRLEPKPHVFERKKTVSKLHRVPTVMLRQGDNCGAARTVNMVECTSNTTQ
jgi:hypothetical protein